MDLAFEHGCGARITTPCCMGHGMGADLRVHSIWTVVRRTKAPSEVARYSGLDVDDGDGDREGQGKA